MQTSSFSRTYIYTPMVDFKKNAMVSLPAMHRSPQMKRGPWEEMPLVAIHENFTRIPRPFVHLKKRTTVELFSKGNTVSV